MSQWQRRLGALPARRLDGGLLLHEATTLRARTRGLARLDELPGDVGLHIRRTRAVHTFGMRFSLDLVWLGRAGEPVRVDRDVAPRRHRMCLRARSVVEVPAGAGERFASALGASRG